MFGHEHQPRKILRVLIVDDNEEWREDIAEIVKIAGCEVGAFASGGEEAFRLMREDNSYDRVITDVCMPDGDGVSLLDKIYKTFGSGTRALTYAHSSGTRFHTEEDGWIYLPDDIPKRFPGTQFFPKDEHALQNIEKFLR
jgi:response regulator RpfG family c-di-GMP phosphodiesterase